MEKIKVAPINSEQKSVLLEYIKKYPDVAKQKFTAEFTFKKARKHWEEVTSMLNSIPGGSRKTWTQWRKTWSDLKKHTKNKASTIKKHNQGTGGGPAIPKDMTDTEKDILELIGPVCQTGHEEITETSINFDFILNEEPPVQVNTLQENSEPDSPFGEVLCIHPKLISPWSVAGIALWLGLVQDLLIPIGLGIVDSRFCTWVSDVYRCASKHTTEKLPQVGLDGKFRPFGLSSQPQSFDLGHHDRSKTLQQIEHRFPITNGSLYTSIDGRLPVIHNYRRHKEFRTGTLKQQDLLSSNVALHSSHISRRELESTPPQNYISCKNCEEDQCPSHSDLHHLSPQYVHRKLSFLQASQNNVFSSNGERKSGDNVLQINANQQNCGFVGNKRLQNTQNSFKRNQILLESSRQRNFPYAVNKRLSQSQESINHLYFGGGSGKEPRIGDQVFCHRSEMNIASPSFNLNTNLNNQMIKNSRNLVRLNKMRLSRSEESLTDFQFDVNIETSQNNQQTQLQPLQHNHTTFHHHQFSSDDEEYGFHENPDNHILKDYDSMSSSNSITTEANCDFEFFQVEKPFTRKVGDNADTSSNVSSEFYNQPAPSRPTQMRNYLSDKEKPKNVSNIRITRTNSKRSLENFQTFIEESLNAKNSEVRRNDDHVSKIIILHRSNSYTTLEDRKRRKKGKKSLSRSSSKASESYKADHIESHQKMKNKKNKSVEYLPNSAGKTVFIDDLSNTNSRGVKYVASSVPDFKKVFISEYI